MMHPTFLRRLADESVRTVLISGCGGGFDFVHGLLLLPDLVRLGKRVIIGSYSFGEPETLTGDAREVFREPPAVVKRVTAATDHALDYAPEIHVCSFLDARLPGSAPHFVYASAARDFTVGSLARFYAQLAEEHELDAVVLVDGGSDSLVVGNECGVGDPVEDAVSVQSVAALRQVPLRMLVVAGLGVDRHNGVSDGATLRAVAELTRQDGFLGAVAVERGHEGYQFYRDAVEHILERQGSSSVVAGAIRDAVEGHYGPGDRSDRNSPGSLFVWPPMGVLWAFDVEAVAARSQVCEWVRSATTPAEAHAAVKAARRRMPIREAEEDTLPDTPASPGDGLYDPMD